MSELVPTDQIEEIVGVKRHPNSHYGRAVTATQTFYILHSQACVDSTPDLRECPFSTAMDRGIKGLGARTDQAVRLDVASGYLVVPVGTLRPTSQKVITHER